MTRKYVTSIVRSKRLYLYNDLFWGSYQLTYCVEPETMSGSCVDSSAQCCSFYPFQVFDGLKETREDEQTLTVSIGLGCWE